MDWFTSFLPFFVTLTICCNILQNFAVICLDSVIMFFCVTLCMTMCVLQTCIPLLLFLAFFVPLTGCLLFLTIYTVVICISLDRPDWITCVFVYFLPVHVTIKHTTCCKDSIHNTFTLYLPL